MILNFRLDMFYFAVMNKNAAETAVAQYYLLGFRSLNTHFCHEKMVFISYFLHVKNVTIREK